MLRIFLFGCLLIAPRVWSQFIKIPDPILKQRLRLACDFDQNGEIDQAEADTVTSFRSNGLQIQDLTGLEQFRNLETVDLNFSPVVDLTPLNGLGLHSLRAAFAQITTLPDPLDWADLTDLNLTNNRLESFPQTLNLPRLQSLFLDGNALVTLPDLSGLADLRTLSLVGNHLVAFPPLGSVQPERIFCAQNRLNTLPPALFNPGLQVFNGADNQLTSLPDLANATALEELIVGHNPLTALPSLDGNVQLRLLDVTGCRLAEIPDLSQTRIIHGVFSKNKLVAFPQLPANTDQEFREWRVSMNRLTVLPDPQMFDSRDKMFLDHNYFSETREQMFKYASQVGFSTFGFSPQFDYIAFFALAQDWPSTGVLGALITGIGDDRFLIDLSLPSD